MASQAQGFWSYVHEDDDGDGGRVKRLASLIKAEYAALTGGDSLELFLDHAEIKWGDEWELRIEEALQATTFFIPVVTPRYFRSEECRKELLGFAGHAKSLGLEELVLPLYYIEVAEVEDKTSGDEAVRLVRATQYFDWRELRLEDEETASYRKGVNRLAHRLVEIARSTDNGGAGPNDSDGPGGSGDDDPPSPGSGEAQGTEPEAREEGGIEQLPFLEMLARGEQALPSLAEAMEGMTEEIETVGQHARETTADIEQSDSQGKGFAGRLAVVNRLAQKLEEPSTRMAELSTQYATDLVAVDPMVLALMRAYEETPDCDPDRAQAEDFFESVKGMTEASSTSAEQVRGLVDILGGSADMSRELRRPANRMREALRGVLDGSAIIEGWAKRIEEIESG